MALQAPFMSGSIVAPVVLLSRVLELCPLFATIAPEHSTQRRIFFNVIQRPLGQESQTPDRPIVQISNDQPNGSQKVLTAASGWFHANGSLQVIIEVDVDQVNEMFPAETGDDEELLRAWDNIVDELTNQIIDTAYGDNGNDDSQLDINRIHEIVAGKTSEQDSVAKGAALVATFKVDWGPQQ